MPVSFSLFTGETIPAATARASLLYHIIAYYSLENKFGVFLLEDKLTSLLYVFFLGLLTKHQW